VLPFLGALMLVALALRPQVISIGPLLPSIRADLGISHGVAGLLGTVPVVCMGLFAPLGPWLARRFGPRMAVGLCAAGVAGFGLLRAFAPGAPAILALTFGIGIGLGAIGPVLSMIVRLRAPDRPALATGSYASGIVLGATVAAAIAVPLAGPGGDWRFALAAFSVAALGSLAVWIVLVPAEVGDQHVDVRSLRLPWGSLTAWVLAVVFGLQSLLFYAAAAWLPNIYVERGWSEADGANLLALTIGMGLVSTIGIPLFADRVGSRRAQLLAAAAVTLVAVLGFTLAGDLGVVWAVALGLGSGALFPLALTLPVDLSDDATEVGATAALMLMAGYALSALGPVAIGLARDLTGDFTAGLWILVGLTVVLLVACAALSPARLGRGVRHTRG
jgi:CP family cyanate transporter-like MFS transporter